MRRLLMLLLLAALPLLAGTMTRNVSFAQKDISFSKAGGYDVVDLQGYPGLINPGEPRLPWVVQSVAIPAGAVTTSVELTAEDWIDLPGVYNVGPAQPDVPLPMPGRTFTPRHYPPDPAVYGSINPYPETKIRLLEAGTMSGYRIAHIEIFPLRYIPATGRLQMATRLSYRLSYQEPAAGDQGLVATKHQLEVFGNAVRRLVVNPEDVDRFAPRIGRSSAITLLPPGHYEYVIVTETPIDTVFQRLADWKTLKGVPGTVVLISWINTNYTGYDLQEKIRNFIKDAWQNWGTVYVLLGGQGDYTNSGQNIFPTRMANYGGQGDEPCDLYYAGLDGTWDRNGNHVYGETTDSTDMYSDVYVGRASVYNVTMARNFVRKVITYEQNPPLGYLKRMLLPTGILWSSYEERPMVESIARMTPPDWQDGRLYERTGALSHQATVDSMNQGWGMGHWDGHGDQNGIYMNGGSTPFFTSTDCDALINGDKVGIHVSIACDPAGWDMVPGGDCFAEHLVNRVGGGAIAAIMNTRYGYGAIGPGGNYVPGPSERLDTTFYAGVLNLGFYSTGEALGYSKASWAPYADSAYQYDMQRYCIYDLNLIGDPELPLWTSEPANCQVDHPAVITIGSHIPFTVTVKTMANAPIASAMVLARKGAEINTSGRTNGSGQVTLDLSPLTPGPMTVTVNAHNYFLHTDTVQVISTARYVAYLRSTIEDPSPGGNGDSILNPGETVRIPTWVKNWGQQTANTVSAKLRTHDPNAQITDSMKTFGDIMAGDSAFTGSNGFGLHVNTGLSNGYTVSCSLICRDALDSTWVSIISFGVGTPVLNEQAVVVRDSVRGNGNGKIDPGEQSDLEVQIKNDGGGHGYNCWAKLRSGDARFIVQDSLANYGLIRKGAVGANLADLFTIYAGASIPMETPVPCTLYLYADGGYTHTQTFAIVVGEIRSVDPIPDGPRSPALYYAYDDVDVNYPPRPTYNWIEINTRGTRLTLSDDQTVTVTVPTGFGPLRYYGSNYTQLSICGNGFVMPGSYSSSAWTNYPLPTTNLAAPALCAAWDDLYPPTGNGVWWMHDAASHALVVEWDSVAYYSPRTTFDKFEIVIFDSSVHGLTNNNIVVIQYKTANGYSSCTAGIQDATQAIGINCLADGNYHRGCAPLAPGRAIKYTTDLPLGIADDAGSLAALAGAGFRAYPNPFRGTGFVAWSVATEGRVTLKVYDPAGRVVRNLVDAAQKPGHYQITWDGKANDGRTVATGIYFLKLETSSGVREQKVVVTR
jgi:hypothetical protein